MKHKLRRFFLGLSALVLILAGIAVATPAYASAPILLGGSSWFGGTGVNVCSNANGGGTDPMCGTETHVGASATYGYWQCVELAQRFYQAKGWYPGIFSGVGYAYQIYDNASGLGMSRQANGSITSIVPGDMIIHASNDPYSQGAGHVAIVDSLSGSTVNVVEQNGSSTGRASYSWSGGTLTRGSNVILGVVHSPKNDSTSGSASWGGAGTATFLGGNGLSRGQQIQANQYLLSSDGRYFLTMQSDGNLVIYSGGWATWNSGTGGNSGAFVALQSDGNVVLYSSSGGVLWSTGTRDIDHFVIQGDGNLVGYRSDGTPSWASSTGGTPLVTGLGTDHLLVGQQINSGQYIQSQDLRYTLLMQSDGNLVMYGPGYHILWNSGTSGNPGAFVALQTDGNVVLYDSPGTTALWSTGTRTISTFAMQSDGNLVGYPTSGGYTWASNTSGKI